MGGNAMKIKSSSRGRLIAVGVVAVLLLALLFWLAASQPAAFGLAFASETMALAVIGSIAIGIERVIETFWTLLGLFSNRYWPLGIWSVEYKNLMDTLDKDFTPFYEKAALAVQKAAEANHWADDNLDFKKAREQLLQVKDSLESVKSSVGGEASGAVITALKGISILQRNYPDDQDLELAASVASQAVDGVTNFISSFKNNPGRKLISIYIGMLLGLALAWFTGIDLFQVTLGSSETATMTLSSHLGVAFTGLILGLGASPTHEVISILQEVKLNRRGVNRS
jgi:hypothetical protein